MYLTVTVISSIIVVILTILWKLWDRVEFIGGPKLKDNIFKSPMDHYEIPDYSSCATRYKKSDVPQNLDAIFIGSGVGSLIAASLLAKIGMKSIVLEKHDRVGGFTHTFLNRGVETDTGVHYIGEMGPGQHGRKLLDALTGGNAIQWCSNGDPLDRVVCGPPGDQFEFEVPVGKENLKQALIDKFPADKKAIDKLFLSFDDASDAFRKFRHSKYLDSLPGFRNKLRSLVYKWTKMWGFWFLDKTVLSFLNGITKNLDLQSLLVYNNGLYGIPPHWASWFTHASAINHYFGGGWYPSGGASMLSRAFVPLIEATGGKILCAANVTDILVENDRAVGVVVNGKDQIRANIVVSGAGVPSTTNFLHGDAEKISRLGKQLQNSQLIPSIGHFFVFLYINKTQEELNLPKYSTWLHLDRRHKTVKSTPKGNKWNPPYACTLSSPSARDPTFCTRNGGKSLVIGLFPCRWSMVSKWANTSHNKRGPEYEELKEQVAEHMIEISQTYFPQIKDSIEHIEVGTALTNKDYLQHPNGASYGLVHIPWRFKQEFLKPRTNLPGFFLTGTDIFVASIYGAVCSGYITASAILQRDLISDVEDCYDSSDFDKR